MSLFNFLAFRLSSQASQAVFHNSITQDACIHNLQKGRMTSSLVSIKEVNKKLLFLENITKRKETLSTESAYRFAKLNPYSRTLFQNLIDKYWQQSIFLSAFNPTNDKYITKLARQRSSSTKEKQKRLFMDFNKALVNDPVHASGITISLSNSASETWSQPVKYIWKKGLNIQSPNSLPRSFSSKKARKYPSKSQKSLLENLSKSNIPLYVVVNGFQQMIIPGPPNDFSNKETIRNTFRQWYHNTFLWEKDEHITYQAWFFVNSQDALEYKDFISSEKKASPTESPIGILPSKFDFYYRLNRKSLPRTEFRLFPDLEEVAKILYEPSYKKGLIFDKRQNMGRSYFQGQPIYFIESMDCIIKGNRRHFSFNPRYKISSDPFSQEHVPIFLTKEAAINAWKNIRIQHPKYRLPSSPKLRVYNLEDFLVDCELQNHSDSFTLMPGPDSSKNTLRSLNFTDQHGKSQNFEGSPSPSIVACKLWIQRLAWSLTRSKPPKWEV